ncbi:hypothetical protein CFOL_v3_10990 [Cephalotus follicularis]|uniref:Uncharacterized protein n=1 Tax=Cephalotus follicularis TaxID=3775 RepID=A0A1Q3BHQ1_CEPFO|nr:hypothetical protein CFOL_v3_10990 [Cephalotus follicularis]
MEVRILYSRQPWRWQPMSGQSRLDHEGMPTTVLAHAYHPRHQHLNYVLFMFIYKRFYGFEGLSPIYILCFAIVAMAESDLYFTVLIPKLLRVEPIIMNCVFLLYNGV